MTLQNILVYFPFTSPTTSFSTDHLPLASSKHSSTCSYLKACTLQIPLLPCPTVLQSSPGAPSFYHLLTSFLLTILFFLQIQPLLSLLRWWHWALLIHWTKLFTPILLLPPSACLKSKPDSPQTSLNCSATKLCSSSSELKPLYQKFPVSPSYLAVSGLSLDGFSFTLTFYIITWSAFFHSRSISRPPTSLFSILVHRLVISWIDYSNFPLFSLWHKSLQKL